MAFILATTLLILLCTLLPFSSLFPTFLEADVKPNLISITILILEFSANLAKILELPKDYAIFLESNVPGLFCIMAIVLVLLLLGRISIS